MARLRPSLGQAVVHGAVADDAGAPERAGPDAADPDTMDAAAMGRGPSLIEALLDDLRGRGFSPGVALVWLNEMKRFGHGQWLAPELAKEARAGLDVQARLRDSLLAVRGDAGMQAWFEQFSVHFSEIKDAEGWQAAMPWMVVGTERKDFLDRLGGEVLHEKDSPMAMARRMESDWDDVAYAVRRDWPCWFSPDAPAAPATAEDRTAFETALREAGLGAMQWPAIGAGSGAALAAMTQGLRQCVHEIESTAGAAPGAGLFGLRGRLRLALGTNARGDVACCNHDPRTTVFVATAPEYGWGPVAHEWLHALDAAAGREYCVAREGGCGFASDLAVARQASLAGAVGSGDAELQTWRRLEHDLQDGARVEKAAFEADLDDARQSLAARWKRQFHNELDDAAVDALVRAGTSGGSEALQTAAKRAFEASGLDAWRAGVRSTSLATEWNILAKARWEPGASLWGQFREQVTQALHDDYYQQPTEIMAHAFESQVGLRFPQSLASDVRPGQQALSYPMRRETAAQGQGWGRFFKALLPQVKAWRDISAPTPVNAPVRGRTAARAG